jgi:septal ring factor EnvC (AmiA/AmiB activator)
LKERIAKEMVQLARLKRRLKAQKKRIADSDQAEKSILEAIEGLDGRLELTRGEVRIQNYHLALAQKRLEDAEQRRREVDAKLAQTEAELRRRFRALYKGVGAPPSLLAWLNSGLADAARMRVYAQRIAQADAGLIRAVHEQRVERKRLTEVVRSETGALSVEKQKMVTEGARLREAREQKRALLASIRRRREKQRQVYKELRAAGRRLQRLLDKSVSAAQGTYLRRFKDQKGLLPWPVSGKIIGRFDPVERISQANLTLGTGITLAARPGEPVRAVSQGRVIYADRLRGYGNLLVVDHGESFYTVYAHGTIPTVRVGDQVKAGQTIAQVGEGGALGRPAIYFEVRQGGKPVDPVRWLRIRTP